MKFTQLPTDAFKEIQLGTGMLCTTFTPSTGTASGQLGATTGGIKYSATPTFKDYGEDVDNCPKNTKELKKLDGWEIKMSGTFVTLDTSLAKSLLAAADIGTPDTTKITPRTDLLAADFDDIWWIGDYSDLNGATNGGFCAIKMCDALSTGGFSLTTSDKSKGQFAFEYTAHYSTATPTTVPTEIYIQAGTAEPA